ncbi:MAG TPA: hypothetical protein VIA06_04525 [Candidatus Dormibacteraeota bacterium]|nr:hypothetical protein [Candidatus Dormibacteraeota bacterium]
MTGRWSARPLALLRLLLVLILGLQLVYWLHAAFQTAIEHGESFSLLQGLLLVAAMLWDLATSGSAITNRGGSRAPRHSRVLIYLGYTLFASSAVAFGSLIPLHSLGDSADGWVEIGIDIIGPAFLTTYFAFGVLRLWRRSPEQPRRPEPQT